MGSVAEGGRTILFVSHQMNQIRRLCNRALWIDAGGLRAAGSAKLLVNQYEATTLAEVEVSAAQSRAAIAFGRWHVETSGSNVVDLDQTLDCVVIRIQARVIKPIRKGRFFITLNDANNTYVWSQIHYDLKLDPGPVTFVLEFSSLPLVPGVYTWNVNVHDGNCGVGFILTPELSVVSKTDSIVDGHYKGILNLASELRLEWETGGSTTSTPIAGSTFGVNEP